MPVARPFSPITNRQGRPLITALGREQLLAQVTDIRERRLAELRPLLIEPERDERHVAQFEHLLQEADELERFIAEAEIIRLNTRTYDGRVVLGSRVLVQLADGSATWVTPVHPREAVLDDERISALSPLGSAILGLSVGATAAVEAPTGVWRATILEVDASGIMRAPKRRSVSVA